MLVTVGLGGGAQPGPARGHHTAVSTARPLGRSEPQRETRRWLRRAQLCASLGTEPRAHVASAKEPRSRVPARPPSNSRAYERESGASTGHRPLRATPTRRLRHYQPRKRRPWVGTPHGQLLPTSKPRSTTPLPACPPCLPWITALAPSPRSNPWSLRELPGFSPPSMESPVLSENVSTNRDLLKRFPS